MTAFGTVGAVLAAVGIAILSDRSTNKRVAAERKAADRQLREQLDHSEEQLRRQQEHSDQQLTQERASADERLQRQFEHAKQLEQDSEAAAVTVIGTILHPDENVGPDREAPAMRPGAFVINKGRYAVRNVEAMLSLDGRLHLPLATAGLRHRAVGRRGAVNVAL